MHVKYIHSEVMKIGSSSLAQRPRERYPNKFCKENKTSFVEHMTVNHKQVRWATSNVKTEDEDPLKSMGLCRRKPIHYHSSLQNGVCMSKVCSQLMNVHCC